MIVVNKADFGGALYIERDCKASVADCSINNNSVEASGGALYSQRDSTLSISKSTLESTNQFVEGSDRARSMIVENKADYGGALFIQENSVASVSECNINNNAAAKEGAIGLYVNSTLSISKSTLESINHLLKSMSESDLWV